MMARRPLSLLLAASAGCVLLVAQQQCAHAFVPPPTAAASAAVRPARTAGAPVQRLYAGTWMRVVCGRYIARAGMCQLMKPNTHTPTDRRRCPTPSPSSTRPHRAAQAAAGGEGGEQVVAARGAVARGGRAVRGRAAGVGTARLVRRRAPGACVGGDLGYGGEEERAAGARLHDML